MRARPALQGHLTRTPPPLGPYRRPMPGVIGRSYGVGRFLMGEVPLWTLAPRRVRPRLLMRARPRLSEMGILLPYNQRQHRTLHIQKDVLPYALC